MKVVIVDYGMGNIKSIVGALTYVGATDISVSFARHDIIAADRLILPGVGSFAKAVNSMHELNLFEILQQAVVANKKP